MIHIELTEEQAELLYRLITRTPVGVYSDKEAHEFAAIIALLEFALKQNSPTGAKGGKGNATH